jgi:S-DNA-T family DNA segregation ATPase FtsK/SpoIIIE
MHYRLKEGALIAMGALCLYLLMALLTYDQTDPGWSHASHATQVQNAAGKAGSFSADILFMVLGYFAYVFPLLLGIKTWQIFRCPVRPWRTCIFIRRPTCRPRRVAPWAKAWATWRAMA